MLTLEGKSAETLPLGKFNNYRHTLSKPIVYSHTPVIGRPGHLKMTFIFNSALKIKAVLSEYM